MYMVIQEEEVFEIVDFTSASEWEVFTSKLEEILLSRQLSLKDKEEVASFVHLNGDWKSFSEDVNFAGNLHNYVMLFKKDNFFKLFQAILSY